MLQPLLNTDVAYKLHHPVGSFVTVSEQVVGDRFCRFTRCVNERQSFGQVLIVVKGTLAGEESPEPPLYSVLCVFVSGVILYLGWGWSHDQIADSRVPENVYLMANALDFSYSHECSSAGPDKPVVFFGAAQVAVLVIPYKLSSFDFAEFLKRRCLHRPASCVSDASINPCLWPKSRQWILSSGKCTPSAGLVLANL